MPDVNKCTRGVLLWSEDVVKFEAREKGSLSSYLRDILHERMARYNLRPQDKARLQDMVSSAMKSRKGRTASERRGGNAPGSGRRSVTVDVVEIPREVARSPKFVRSRRRKAV